jgi:hypothetical protein
MPFDPDFETIAGTKLRIVAGRPTDDTTAAYATLFTGGGDEFELTNVGAVEGRDYSEATISVVSSGRERAKPGTFRFPAAEFGIVWLPESDAHQTAETALASRAICSFELERQSGQLVYFTGYVRNLSESGGGPNDALTGTLSILRDSEVRKPVTP